MAKQELAVIESTRCIAPSVEYLDSVMEDLDGISRIPFGRVKIPTAGGSAFEVFELAEEESHAETEVRGVIVLHNASNAYWPDKFNGENTPPACKSEDGKTGVDAATGEVRRCETCEYNKFGSALDERGNVSRGKACRNTHMLYVLREGGDDTMPLLMMLPPTSLPSFNNYRIKVALGMKRRLADVVTGITLKKEKNADGITVSKAVFQPIGLVSDTAQDELASYASALKRYIGRIQESIAAYEAEPGSESSAPASYADERGATEPPAGQDGFAPVCPEEVPFDMP